MKYKNYADAGVSIEEGDRFARHIAELRSPAVSRSIGGFAGGLELPPGMVHPVILSSTDGVGTKILVARALGRYDTIGIDLVAMCVNDLLVAGARPLSFQDYIACGRLDRSVLDQVIHGIVRGCELAECVLTGGETAEMPDMYAPDEIDLAGFAVGVAEKGSLLPVTDSICAGDAVFGVASGGIHSNGLSLARKIIPESDTEGRLLLLEPTRIYAREMRVLRDSGMIRAAAHITGGGLAGNLVRVIPSGLAPRPRWDWPVPEVFDRIQHTGKIGTEEMRKVFNMGVGLAVVVSRSDADAFVRYAGDNDVPIFPVGTVEADDG
jgi:phosphoribosylformylglycinamidine cyclo-ligase